MATPNINEKNSLLEMKAIPATAATTITTAATTAATSISVFKRDFFLGDFSGDTALLLGLEGVPDFSVRGI